LKSRCALHDPAPLTPFPLPPRRIFDPLMGEGPGKSKSNFSVCPLAGPPTTLYRLSTESGGEVSEFSLSFAGLPQCLCASGVGSECNARGFLYHGHPARARAWLGWPWYRFAGRGALAGRESRPRPDFCTTGTAPRRNIDLFQIPDRRSLAPNPTYPPLIRISRFKIPDPSSRAPAANSKFKISNPESRVPFPEYRFPNRETRFPNSALTLPTPSKLAYNV